MDLTGSILDRLPSYVPRTDIRVDEEHTFEYINEETPRTVYEVDKAPYETLVEVEAIVDGVQQELSIGPDVEARDTNGDDELDSVAFTSSDKIPDEGSTFTVTYICEPIISRYIGEYDDDIESVSDRIDTNVTDSKSVETAEGIQLDLLGREYGELGRRQARPDGEYRGVLRSLVSASTGRGKVDDIKFSIATAVGTDKENVIINEDFDEVGYSISVDDPGSAVEMSSLTDVIELTRPSGVELLRSPIFYGADASVTVEAESSTYSVVKEGLGSGTLGDEQIE